MTLPVTEVFEAANRDESIIAVVGCRGESRGVRLGPEAMELSDGELAIRIVELTTLAHLRAQLAQRGELEAAHAYVHPGLATGEQVRAFEDLIDF